MLDVKHCRARQQRLLQTMGPAGLDAVVIGARHHVQYLTAHRADWRHEVAFAVFADGRTWLATANQPARDAAADEVVGYEANWLGTLRQEQPATLAALVVDRLRGRAGTIGVDSSPASAQVAITFDGNVRPIDETLHQLRRQKDPDELSLIRVALRAAEAMYDRARQIIEPGVEELHVFGQLHEAAVRATGEPMTAPLGNDYACGAGGGPPRKDRAARAGELYVLDVGPTYRGYFADACRAFAVDHNPTDAQLNAWEAIRSCFPIIEQMARPGVRCRDIYAAVDEHLKLARGNGMPHHLGHGIGLQPHEFPHLNPRWDDVLMENEVFTVEPGIYSAELAGGIRLENVYRVTKTGVESLVTFPLELA